MIEPTESEPLEELDRFIDAMLAIRAEAQKVQDGHWPAEDNPLVNSPHTASQLTGEWEHPYSEKPQCSPLPDRLSRSTGLQLDDLMARLVTEILFAAALLSRCFIKN